MPNIKSAVKKDKQDKNRTKNNRAYEKQIEDIMNNAQKKVTGAKKIESMISEAYRKIDKAATKAVIHPNKANRLKSRVTRLLAK